MFPKDTNAPPPPVPRVRWHLKVLALLDNYGSIKADLYNIEETNEDPCRSKRLTFILQSNLGYEYETNIIAYSQHKSEL